LASICPDALARDGETLSDLFQRVLAPVPDAEPHLDHFFSRGVSA